MTTERRAQFVGLLRLAVLALISGAASGLVGAIFRLTLAEADRSWEAVIAGGHDRGVAGFFLVCGGAAATVALAAWLIRRFSQYASGIGFPHVEAALNEEVPPARLVHQSLALRGHVAALLQHTSGLLRIGRRTIEVWAPGPDPS